MKYPILLAILGLTACEQPCPRSQLGYVWIPEITHTHSHHLIPTTHPAHWSWECRPAKEVE